MPPRMLFEGQEFVSGFGRMRFEDIDLAGQRFLMIKDVGAATDGVQAAASIMFVENWFEELNRLVPPN